MKSNLLLILCMLTILPVAIGQKISTEHYVWYTPQQRHIGNSIQLFFQSHSDWVLEARYGYDAPRTFSVNFGRSITFDNNRVTLTGVPAIGLVAGFMSGVNINFDQEIEWRSLYFAARLQYFFSTRDRADNFFYKWIESGVSFSEKFFGGISLQGTLTGHDYYVLSKGIVVVFSSGRLSFPVYLFDPFNSKQNIITGILYSFKSKRS